MVKIYDSFDRQENRMLTSWRSIPELQPDETGNGIVIDWQQMTGQLLVSGDVRMIKVWDAERELCVLVILFSFQDIPTRSTNTVTCLTSDKMAGNLVVAGFSDGSLRLYDRRLGKERYL